MASRSDRDIRDGDILADRFVIEKLVARGGFGKVFRAYDRETGLPVAVKLLLRKSHDVRVRFLNECTHLAELHHPGIVGYVAHGCTAADDVYLVMEWLEGEDLASYLARAARTQLREEQGPDAEVARSTTGPLHGQGDREEATVSLVTGRGAGSGRDRPDVEVTKPLTAPLHAQGGGEEATVSLVAGRAPEPAHDSPEATMSLVADTAVDSSDTATSPDSQATRTSSSAQSDSYDSYLISGTRAPSERGDVSDSGGYRITGPQLPVDTVLAIGRRLASAVAELHRRGIVHRDIKPANLFLANGDVSRVKLLDLGAMWRRTLDRRFDDAGYLIGTPYYMAPEQARAAGDICPATDVWAIGCILYECLSGFRPFYDRELKSVLARILVDTPPPLTTIRPDVPDALSMVIERALDKSTTTRFPNADALRLELDHILAKQQQTPRAQGRRPRVTLTSDERRVTCVLLAMSDHLKTLSQELQSLAQNYRCDLQQLADGTFFAVAKEEGNARELAWRLGRVALALVNAEPSLRVVLATARSQERRPAIGTMLRNASRRLRKINPGMIYADEMTAPLLVTRFYLERTRRGVYVYSEQRGTEAGQPLMGRASTWVGRQKELATMLSSFQASLQGNPSVIVITGEAGIGKSRLCQEFQRAVLDHDIDVEVFHGAGDPIRMGAPFLLLAPAIRDKAGITQNDSLEVSQEKLRQRISETVIWADVPRICAFIGEMCGIPFDEMDHESLRAARKDPMLMAQSTRRAWQDWLAAECAHHPVLLMLEDLHWGDLPSINCIQDALDVLTDKPLMVVATSRPEIKTEFPNLWGRHKLEEIALAGLSNAACTTLIRATLGDNVSHELIATIIDRAGGNAFYLEELVRAVASGTTELPDTVLGMVQSRLDALGDEAKHVLRAASIFGESFWTGGIKALIGENSLFEIEEWLAALVADEVVLAAGPSRIVGQGEYRFRHALVRDGAYAMLTEEDRVLGHELAAIWLESVGERDSVLLAEHFQRGNQHARAVPYFLRAAEQALEANDLQAALRRAEQGVKAGASGETLGKLRSLQSSASFWLGHYSQAVEYGVEASHLLEEGKGAWYTSLGNALVSCARLDNFDRVTEIFQLIMQAPCADDAQSEQMVNLCRGTFQLIFNGRLAEADRVLQHVRQIADTDQLDAFTYAQLQHVQGTRAAFDGNIGANLRHFAEAVDAFERAGDIRNVALERTSLAWTWAEIGQFDYAVAMCKKNLAFCKEIHAQGVAITHAKVQLGYMLSNCQGCEGEAKEILSEAIEESIQSGNTRQQAWARVHMANLALRAGDYDEAERQAAMGVELFQSTPGLKVWAIAVRGRVLLAQGRINEALELAFQASKAAAQHPALLQGDGLPPLLLAQALHAAGRQDEARVAMEAAVTRLLQRARRLNNPEWYQSFLQVPEHAETLALARAWGIRTDDADG